MGKSRGRHYTSYLAILVESAAPIVVSNLILVIAMKTSSECEIMAFQASIHIQVITPLLIVLRILKGNDWSPAPPSSKDVDLENVPQTSTPSPLEPFDQSAPDYAAKPRNSLSSIVRFTSHFPTPTFHSAFDTKTGSENDVTKMTEYSSTSVNEDP
ncbi:hypothetical protein CC1G_14392 [Coprinopsis cinerea okayama7|uniref:Uncharacterized protein n=1 Tax=Coprinopsis cinerea (strain Okayama-7 / 130 / ATCC MYA-4618 / FGSC 9003) TaxID=240176 RepID=D6RM88_COPC7|nr:hypothetical protein CC1G_14392 [Coprinopsis cinerea okayama7\|eukprot:XP_002911395.1 hypothetical protein CC1G_14392 [Coprinopsis cinerea okayama7\